jgi:hypothetical protein
MAIVKKKVVALMEERKALQTEAAELRGARAARGPPAALSLRRRWPIRAQSAWRR